MAAPTFPQKLAEEIAADLRSGDAVRITRGQRSLGVAQDGKPGPRTFAALLAHWPASFPLARTPRESWHEGMRAFGASRSNGRRSHAGCDLYAPKGTPVYAVADGVVRRVAGFYAGTDAVEIDHRGFVARYGEVDPGSVRVSAGDTVKRGQPIGKVGHLVGISVPSDMLHLEIYAGSVFGPLTVAAARGRFLNGRPTLRRSDLLDPSAVLDVWAGSLPKP